MTAEVNALLRDARERTPSRLTPGHAMSRTELALVVHDHIWRNNGVRCPIGRKYIGKLEAGTIRWPNARYRQALREILNAQSDAELGFVSAQLARAVPVFGAELLVPWTPGGVLDVLDALDMNRRDLLKGGFGLVTGDALARLVLDWLLVPTVPAIAQSGGVQVTDLQVDAINGVVDQLRLLDDRVGSDEVLALTHSQINAVGQLLRNGTYTDDIGRRLHATAAELLRFSGWLYWDQLHHTAAQRSWNAALRAAHVAGDNQIGANVLAFMSGQADEMGNVDDAVRLGTAACSRLQGSGRVAAIAQFQLAIAAGGGGRDHDCRTALDNAVAAYQSPPHSHGDPAWAYWMDEAHLAEMTGRSLLLLGDHAGAIDHLTTYVTETEGREQVRGRLFLACALAGAGSPEQACEQGSAAIDLLAGNVCSPRNNRQLRLVRDAVEPFDLPEVHEFHERLRDLA